MDLAEFEKGFLLLRGAYGDRVFPKERESVLWNRYRHTHRGIFSAAVEKVILRMPAPNAVIEWLDADLRVETVNQNAGISFQCPPCRDFGIGFIGDTVVACSCASGRRLTPNELARQQANYDRGRAMFKAPGRFQVSSPLPYDQNERINA